MTADKSSPEDRRQAAVLVTSLSATVTTVTLAVAAGVVGLGTVIVDKYNEPASFWVLVAFSVGALATSGFLGGRGVADIAGRGAGGKWTTKTENRSFAKQVAAGLVGAAALFAAVVLGLTADRDASGGVSRAQVATLEKRLRPLSQLVDLQDQLLRRAAVEDRRLRLVIRELLRRKGG